MNNALRLFSLLLAVYFGVISASPTFTHECEHSNGFNHSSQHNGQFHNFDKSTEEKKGEHDHRFYVECATCDELEDRKKIARNNKIHSVKHNYAHDFIISATDNFTVAILFRLAPPLRGPPPA